MAGNDCVMNLMNRFLRHSKKKAQKNLKRFSDAFSICIPLCRVRKSIILKYIRFIIHSSQEALT